MGIKHLKFEVPLPFCSKPATRPAATAKPCPLCLGRKLTAGARSPAQTNRGPTARNYKCGHAVTSPYSPTRPTAMQKIRCLPHGPVPPHTLMWQIDVGRKPTHRAHGAKQRQTVWTLPHRQHTEPAAAGVRAVAVHTLLSITHRGCHVVSQPQVTRARVDMRSLRAVISIPGGRLKVIGGSVRPTGGGGGGGGGAIDSPNCGGAIQHSNGSG